MAPGVPVAIDVTPLAGTQTGIGRSVVELLRALARMWTRSGQPSIGRAFRNARVLHATNYLVPPTRLPTLVTLHDCALVRHATLCTPHVRSLAPVIRRAFARGAHAHVPSHFVARETEDIFGP